MDSAQGESNRPKNQYDETERQMRDLAGELQEKLNALSQSVGIGDADAHHPRELDADAAKRLLDESEVIIDKLVDLQSEADAKK